MARRPTTSDYLAAWRLDSELRGGHSPSEVLRFVSELQDLADEQAGRYRALPMGVILADSEPKWRTRLNRWLGR
jgi:hypothetical protein